jgi:hypothetical protein
LLPNVGDIVQVNFSGLEQASIPGYIVGEIESINSGGGFHNVKLTNEQAVPQSNPTLVGDEQAFVIFNKSGADGNQGVDGARGATGATGPASPFRYTIERVDTTSAAPGTGKLIVDTNGNTSFPVTSPYIQFSTTDLDSKNIRTFLQSFVAVGDMIHISSKDENYYGYGNVVSIDDPNRRVFVTGFTADGTFTANTTEASISVAKRGNTGEGGELQYYRDADIPAEESTTANPIDTLQIVSGDTSTTAVTLSRTPNGGAGGADLITYEITASGSPSGPGGGAYGQQSAFDAIVFNGGTGSAAKSITSGNSSGNQSFSDFFYDVIYERDFNNDKTAARNNISKFKRLPIKTLGNYNSQDRTFGLDNQSKLEAENLISTLSQHSDVNGQIVNQFSTTTTIADGTDSFMPPSVADPSSTSSGTGAGQSRYVQLKTGYFYTITTKIKLQGVGASDTYKMHFQGVQAFSLGQGNQGACPNCPGYAEEVLNGKYTEFSGDGVYDVEFTCYLNTTGPSQPNFVGFYPVVALLTDKQPKLQEVEVIVKATV